MTTEALYVITVAAPGVIFLIVFFLFVVPNAKREKNKVQQKIKSVGMQYPCPVCSNKEFELAEERGGFVTLIKLPGRKPQQSSLMMCKKCGLLLRFTTP